MISRLGQFEFKFLLSTLPYGSKFRYCVVEDVTIWVPDAHICVTPHPKIFDILNDTITDFRTIREALRAEI